MAAIYSIKESVEKTEEDMSASDFDRSTPTPAMTTDGDSHE